MFHTTYKQTAHDSIKPDNTLAGKIDLKHINDIRRVLRIRYASRTNIDKLFATYDASGKGYVDANDIHDLSEHLGVKISLD